MWPEVYICDLLDSLEVAVCEFDAQNRAVRWNSRFVEFFPEHTEHIHVGEDYAENLRRFYKVRLEAGELPDLERYVAEGITRHRQQQQPFDFTHHGRTVKVASLPLPEGGRVRMWREVRRPDAQQQPSAIPAFDLLDHIPDGACVTDAQGRIMAANAEFRRLYDMRSNDLLVGQTFEDLVSEAWRAGNSVDALRAKIRAGLTYDGAPFEIELPRSRWRRVVNRRQAGGLAFQVHADITDSKLQQQQLLEAHELLRQKNAALAELARTDSLTGLANRRQFIDQLTLEIERSGSVSLIAIDIDNFKSINDRFGHPIVDACIRKTGRLIDACAKAAGATSARIGGEEFAIIVSDTPEVAERIAIAVHNAVAAANWSALHPEIGKLTVSIGIAGGWSPDEVQVAADRALYDAKSQGRDMTVRLVA